MEKDQRSKRRGGFYFINEVPYLSVTKILSVIDKSQPLMYWFGQAIWEGMVADPSLSWEQARAIPYKLNASAKDRGTAVHTIVESYTNTEIIPDVTNEFAGYKNAFEQWVNDFNVKIVAQEKTIKSDIYRYAGTLDMLATVNGELRIVDIKTGKELYPEVNLQTSAYRQALKEQNIEVKNTSALLLMEDGTYKYQLNRDELEAFLACKTLFIGINKSLCEKVGYN